MLTQLALYRMDDLSGARSRDVLKLFYQALIPETLRKTLGEFYTPDWLADITCDRAQIDDWSAVRVLDPTCGSGSFLLEVIRRKRQLAEGIGLPPAKTLSTLLNEVWGFDLNPLAVQTARLNFLIAIADLVAAVNVDIELPVLLADAVCSPAPSPPSGRDYVEYEIGGVQASLNVLLPSALALDPLRLDAAFGIMGDAVQQERKYEAVEQDLIAHAIMDTTETEIWHSALRSTYEQVLDLHKRARNAIGFRMVRNFFRSAVAGQFDLVVGNPPWVRWSNLPEPYRQRIKPTCERYPIFSETPWHGGNELDISGMITYTVADKWLKPMGALVFVITQTHFQSPSSQGFRSFRIHNEANLIPESVDDLKSLKPFPRVANKTAIVRLRKVGSSEFPTYPVPCRVWERTPGASGSIPESLGKEAVLARVTQKSWEANPVNGGNSPWAILPPGRFAQMEALQGQSDWITGRKGVTADLNAVYMLHVIDEDATAGLVQVETRPNAGKTDIGPARRFWIEPELLYPLLKGAADFSACHVHVQDRLHILVPNKGITTADYAAAEEAMVRFRQTRKFLAHYKDLLQKRSTYRLRQRNAPFYAVYNSGSYTFSPFKVVWAELSTTFQAAVLTAGTVPLVGHRPFVPDHKVYFADFQSGDIAHFVCGLLNSTLVREYVESHTIHIQVANIFKHLRIPRFDASECGHLDLARTSRQAHAAASQASRSELLGRLDQIAERILRA
ncbi:MAG: N-6 DNA methylase [Alphaproteobacteria bacterium]|nr:N-6 DNA methylase [Alphaproteobacteria bacterium]